MLQPDLLAADTLVAPPTPNPVRTAPARARIIHVHFPVSSSLIDPTVKTSDKSRWAVWSHMPADQAMAILCRRQGRAPWDLSCRENEAGEVLLYIADARLPEALVIEGFSGEEGREALKSLGRSWRRHA